MTPGVPVEDHCGVFFVRRFKDCLAALVPYYDDYGSNATLIFTIHGEVFTDHRTVKWNLRRLARLFCVDLESARQEMARFLHYSQGLPLPLSPSLVLVPLKTRTAVGKNDGCHGYFNPSAVVSFAASGNGKSRSSILLPGDHLLPCLYRPGTVQKRLRDGAIALERHRTALLIPGEPAGPDCKNILEGLARAFLSGLKKDNSGQSPPPER